MRKNLHITDESKFNNKADNTVTINGIKRSLKIALQNKFPDAESSWINSRVEKILKRNGLHKDNFNIMLQFQRHIAEQTNDISIDDNSNKGDKSIASVFSEIEKSGRKMAGFDMLYRTMKEFHGKKRAKYLSGRMYSYDIGLSDSNKIFEPYCYCMNSSRLVTDSRDFGILHSTPAKHLLSYTSQLNEQLHELSNHLAGAIAVGMYFFDLTNIMCVQEKVSLEELKDPKTRKMIQQHMQSTVHSFCSLSRMGVESPFSNLSIFDRYKIKYLVENEIPWYFSASLHDSDYITDYVCEMQDIFLEYFDKGDPTKSGKPYRFPVVTANMSKKRYQDDKEDNRLGVTDLEYGEWYICDPDFLLKFVSKYDIKRYNIFMSEGTKVASCCRLVNDVEMLEMAASSNGFGAGALSDIGSHRVATGNYARPAYTCESFDEYMEEIDNILEDCRDILVAHKALVMHTNDINLQKFIKNGWINMNRMFSTMGILGTVEAQRALTEKFGEYDYQKDILQRISEKCVEYTLDKSNDCKFNSEVIPAESYAVRLAQTDLELYGEEHVKYPIYANQFHPLWEAASSVWEKLDTDGKYNSIVTGGMINHIPVDGAVTPTQALRLIRYAVKCGCEHFAINGVYSECENNHTTDANVDTCPTCGGKIVSKITRAIGYFSPVENWSPTKQEFDFPLREQYELE